MFSLAIATQSGVILLREGLEALLIISALAALLRRAQATAGLRALYLGAAAAVIFSGIAAIIFAFFFNGAHDDRIEALVMILAAALMFYMSGWLFLRQDSRVLMAELKQSTDRALSQGTAFSIAAIAFLAVFREGAETVLFLHALAAAEGGYTPGFFVGIGAACLALALIFIALQWFALRMPLRPVFLLTSAMLFMMGLKFIGGGMQELQEQALLPVTPLPWLDAIREFGFNPTREAVAVQSMIVLAALVSVSFAHFRERRKSHNAATLPT